MESSSDRGLLYESEAPRKALQAQVMEAAQAHHPGQLAISLYKFSNVAFSCATASLIRTVLTRAKPAAQAAEAQQGAIPSWLQADFKKKAASSGYMRQYFRDMGLLIGCSYLMEGVESGLEAVRGTKDRYNKLCGGVAAGGVLGFAWFPRQPFARLAMTGTGALVGYLSYITETASRRLLLDRQHKLEQELLGLPPQLHKQDLDTVYLQELFRIRQKQQIANGVPEREQKVNELNQLFRPHAQPQASSSTQEIELGKDPATSADSIWGDGFEESGEAAPAEQPLDNW
eukprot:CAMPEP_0202342376 /NCGR_PEP_ID=MMETSP1126-20121109/2968_1 /ASSEMBLY_ACC=CAM_ASM_000457 /TAXON_ID=3047 /ORGANISM="Dunaliella tertiolecta, Strain CCMP1320" /LENGTH=286 /DNA_ID=CAMNT_0048933325 /DNA_START=124 /DNA_END=981 /DNA_ORIENTATION=+